MGSRVLRHLCTLPTSVTTPTPLQLTVNTTFSCGASVMAAMAALVDGRQRVEEMA